MISKNDVHLLWTTCHNHETKGDDLNTNDIESIDQWINDLWPWKMSNERTKFDVVAVKNTNRRHVQHFYSNYNYCSFNRMQLKQSSSKMHYISIMEPRYPGKGNLRNAAGGRENSWHISPKFWAQGFSDTWHHWLERSWLASSITIGSIVHVSLRQLYSQKFKEDHTHSSGLRLASWNLLAIMYPL